MYVKRVVACCWSWADLHYNMYCVLEIFRSRKVSLFYYLLYKFYSYCSCNARACDP